MNMVPQGNNNNTTSSIFRRILITLKIDFMWKKKIIHSKQSSILLFTRCDFIFRKQSINFFFTWSQSLVQHFSCLKSSRTSEDGMNQKEQVLSTEDTNQGWIYPFWEWQCDIILVTCLSTKRKPSKVDLQIIEKTQQLRV